ITDTKYHFPHSPFIIPHSLFIIPPTYLYKTNIRNYKTLTNFPIFPIFLTFLTLNIFHSINNPHMGLFQARQ
ncbi:MAG: hypothetical protein WAM60_22205, partial [Candidatus Promineifilaceae bacterium]